MVAGVLALCASLPAVWWEPLHPDEVFTLTIAPRPFGRIVDVIFVDRGEAPLHFFIEHAALTWPGGIEGLRIPSVVCFLLALPAATLVFRALVGDLESSAAVVVLGLAPLAVKLATFGRMYALFLAAFLWATWAGLLAAERGGHLRWAVAGALLGSLVYVHPIAPLYASVGLLLALLHARVRPQRLARDVWPCAAAFVLASSPYYVYALHRLRERFYVGYTSSTRTETTHGRSVAEEILFALTPGGRGVALLLFAFAVLGVAALAARRWRSALGLTLWILLPVAFFSFVPTAEAGGAGSRFFDRYVLCALPAFVLLVVIGCFAVGRVFGRPTLVGALLVAGVFALEAVDDGHRLDRLHAVGLSRVASAVANDERDGVLFSAAGTLGSERPSSLLDEFVALELPAIERVSERDSNALAAWIRQPREARIGLWLFRGPLRRIKIALRRLRDVPDVEGIRVAPTFLLVRSTAPRSRRQLVAEAYLVREAWSINALRDRAANRLREVDRNALLLASSSASRVGRDREREPAARR